MNAIPLIRARYLHAFSAAAEKVGLRALMLCQDLKIPEGVLENAEALHPASQLFAFAGQAARLTGRIDLGLAAGRTKLDNHGVFGAQVARSSTLKRTLETFCAEAQHEYSRAVFWLGQRGETHWFCRGPIDGPPDERRQVELYLVELMLQTVRTKVGQRWYPSEILLQSEERDRLRNAESLSSVDVRFGCSVLAIPVPRTILSRSVPRSTCESSTSVGATRVTESETPATDFVGSLRQIVETYLSSGHPRIEELAEATDTSVRTLQRRLAAVGLSYSQVVDEVRLRKAVPLLKDPNMLITDIAFGLGYLHPAHFSRAFRRWAGVSPSEYRADVLTC
ncbi:MAG: AraC family transcriptional regulator [bacterium]|nr:AraC family transcriptional regulator [bacterium]